MTMRFAFTDDQLALRDAVRDLLDKQCAPEHVRAAWDAPDGRVPGLWDQLAEMGVTALLAPEEQGGLGMTMLDLILILEETGRAALPEPVVEHAGVAQSVVPDLGDTTTSALLVDGFVPYADSVDALLLGHGNELHLVHGSAVRLTPRESVDGARRLFAVEWEPQAATLVGGPAERDDAFAIGALGTAAQLCGLADRMITMTVDYAKERKQFGVPIGSFQAVKHHLADARLALEFARPLVYRAAYSVAHRDPERRVHASMAKAQASDAASVAGKVALQCHGAIAYTVEYDLHLYLKRTWALARSWGDASTHRELVARATI